jgi:hypothetical protein
VSLEHVHEEEREMNFNSQGKRYDDLLDVIRRAVYGAE